MPQIGDKVRFVPSGSAMAPGEEKRRAVTGTVYYVNHLHRHYGVVADLGSTGYKIRETFKF